MRKFSEVLDEYLDARQESPFESEWRSIDENAAARNHHHAHLQRLRDEMDAMVSAPPRSKA